MYSKFYERYMLMGDFNVEELEPCLSQFLFEMNAKNIAEEHTCYKSLSNQNCIDLVIANRSSSFQNTRQYQRAYRIFAKWL